MFNSKKLGIKQVNFPPNSCVDEESAFRAKGIYSPSRLASFSFCPMLAYLENRNLTKQSRKMRKGQILHKYFREFNVKWIDIIKDYDTCKASAIGDIWKRCQQNILRSIKKQVIYRELNFILDNWVNELQSSFEAFSNQKGNKRINPGDFLVSFWGGKPEFEFPHSKNVRTRADVVGLSVKSFTHFELKTGRSPETPPIWHVIQTAASAMIISDYLDKRCKQIVLIYNGRIEKRISLTKELEKQVFKQNEEYSSIISGKNPPNVEETQKCSSCSGVRECKEYLAKVNMKSSSETALNGEDTTKEVSIIKPTSDCDLLDIGDIIQTRDKQYTLNLKKDNELFAKIRQEHANKIYPGMPVIAYSQEMSDLLIYCEIIQASAYHETASTNYRSFSELNTWVKLTPFLQITDSGRISDPRLDNLNFGKVRFASSLEIAKAYSLSEQGLAFGVVNLRTLNDIEWNPATIVPYRYPIEKTKIGFKGIFTTGGQGKGKTNFLKLFVAEASSYYGGGRPPAIVIIDVEGQFSRLQLSTRKASDIDLKIWDTLSTPICNDVQVYRLSSRSYSGNSTLDLSQLAQDDLIYMLPELEEKSTIIVKKLIREEFWGSSHFTFNEFQTRLTNKVNTDKFLHRSQKEALIRAIQFCPDEYFDQEGQKIEIEDLLKPGKVSVIDCSLFTRENQRFISLYLLLAFAKHKIYRKTEQSVYLVVDEAHEIFPKVKSGQMSKSYLERTTSQVATVIRRGRKRDYGFVFATQSPKDVAPFIIKLCQTKVIFGVEDSDWVKSLAIDNRYAKSISLLKRGEAFIWCPELHGKPVKIKVSKARSYHEED